MDHYLEEILGPGEVYADTNLEEMVQDALRLDDAEGVQ